MTTLNANAKRQNVKASVESYLRDKLILEDITNVDWDGVPFESEGLGEWVQPRIIFGGGIYYRQVSASTKGNVAPVFLNINFFVDQAKTKEADRVHQLRDLIFDYFKIGSEIPLYDAANGNFTTALQTMEVSEVVTDTPIPNDLFSQYNLTVVIDWLEEW